MTIKLPTIPPIPTTPVHDCRTFKPPPLDGSLTLPELFDWHLHNSPKHPLFVYSDEHGDEHVLLWPQVVRAVHRAGRIAMDRVKRVNPRGSEPDVVAIFAAEDSITYFSVMAGIIRAGFTPFPISPRNSPAAIAHLLRKTNASHVLVGHKSALLDDIASSFNILEVAGDSKPGLSSMITFNEIYRPTSEPFQPLGPGKYKLDDPAIILHSSGSTAFPKPIAWTHYRFLQIGLTPYFGEVDFAGRRASCHSTPMYHCLGAMQMAWTAMTGVVMTTFEPRSPAIFPDPDSVIKSCMDTKSEMIFCVPSFIEAWSRNKEYVEFLKSIFGVLYGGGPLNKSVGDRLWKLGVGIFMLYGCTEAGTMSLVLPAKSAEDWDYFKLSSNITGKFIPDGSGNLELVIVPNPYTTPSVYNSTLDGVDVYATSDLLTPHPTKPNYWKIFGRVDDQIMHANGEKTNPGPLEKILNQDPHVLASVMFGRGRFNPGVLIDPLPEFKFDPSDKKALRHFRDLIWPTVESMNEYAPQHSRIFKEMILVCSSSKPFTYTAKNTVRRQGVIADYDDEIDALYTEIRETTQSRIPPPIEWSLASSRDFVRIVVNEVLKREISDDSDLFECGCDSLQATFIRNTILNALRATSSLDPNDIPGSFVYQHPSISSLSTYISSLVEIPKYANGIDTKAAKIDAMHRMALKYSANFRQQVGSRDPDGEVVLLTGTTGGLGSLILAELLQSDVKRVYAINRKGRSLLDRQSQAFKERGVDVKLASSEKLVLLEADLTTEGYGLHEHTVEEIKNSVTHIIHSAYPVNFNKSLSSFESAIFGLRRLVDLALSSTLKVTPRLIFVSSISTVNAHPGDDHVKEDFVDASSAVGLGYSESKWVCENLLNAASARTSLKPVIVRVGQMCGMTASGAWNTKEWVPALFKSSLHLGCLPLVDNDVTWIPIDVAARVFCDVRNADYKVLHLAHPNPASWASVFSVASQELGIPLVPYSDWLEKLLQSSQNLDAETSVSLMERSPALRILDFFRDSGVHESGQHKGREAMGVRRLDLTLTVHSSPTLRDQKVPPLDGDSASSWISYWRSVGFLDN